MQFFERFKDLKYHWTHPVLRDVDLRKIKRYVQVNYLKNINILYCTRVITALQNVSEMKSKKKKKKHEINDRVYNNIV